jgi:hypothetical protein
MDTSIFHRDTDASVKCQISDGALELAKSTLLGLGVTEEQMNQVTGFGLRRLGFCKPEDTILNKFACGALSAYGVMGTIFGTDSPQHHRGNNL